mgnify:CR=1 FL=1
MLNWQDFDRIYIRPGYTDMRKAISGLCIMAEQQMKLNVFEKNIFLFCGKTRRNLKVLFWDKNGFCLLQKKLEQDKYVWPKTEAEALELTHADLNLLMQGLDIWARHKELFFSSVS